MLSSKTAAPTIRGVLALGGMLLAVSAPHAQAGAGRESNNPIANPGFEGAIKKGAPVGWTARGLAPPAAEFAVVEDEAPEGNRCVMVEVSPEAADGGYAWWTQQVSLRPGARYRLSAAVRATGENNRAGISVHFYGAEGKLGRVASQRGAAGRNEWKRIVLDFQSPRELERAMVNLSLGAPGQAWFDDIRLVEGDNMNTAADSPYRRPDNSAPGDAWDADTVYNQYGGYRGLRGTATGWFHVEKIDDRFWLVDPEGCVFLSKGATGIRNQSFGKEFPEDRFREVCREKYGDDESWALATRDRLRSWGLNTASAWATPEIHGKVPYVANLNLAGSAFPENEREVDGKHMSRFTVPQKIPAVFHPRFGEWVRQKLAEWETTFDDPWCVGHFTDNEWIHVNDFRSYVKFYLEWDGETYESYRHGKRAVAEWLEQRYGTLGELKKVYDFEAEDFGQLAERVVPCEVRDSARAFDDHVAIGCLIAERYQRICREEIRRVDPHHLILGIRQEPKPDPVFEACAPYVDVVCLNDKPYLAPIEKLERLHEKTGKPILFSEYAMISIGSDGRGALDDTRPETVRFIERRKAEHFGDLMEDIYSCPFVIGSHYFKYVDYPRGHEFKGLLMQRHVGLVTKDDEPKEPFISAFARFHRELESRVLSDYRHRRFTAIPVREVFARMPDGAVRPWKGAIVLGADGALAPQAYLLCFHVAGEGEIIKAGLPFGFAAIDDENADFAKDRHWRAPVDIFAAPGSADSIDDLVECERKTGRGPGAPFVKADSEFYGLYRPVCDVAPALAARPGAEWLCVRLSDGGKAPEPFSVHPAPLRVWRRIGRQPMGD